MADPTTFGQRFNKSLVEARSSVAGYNQSSANQAGVIKELAYKAYVVAQEAVYQGSTGIIVEAWLPETLATDINATYEAPFAQGLNQVNPNLGAIARFMGINLTTQALTAQIWQGGGFIDMSIPLIFQTETNAANDVMEPIKKLFSLTLPKDPEGGGLLQAPGPTIDIGRLDQTGREQLSNQSKKLGTALSQAASGALESVSGGISSLFGGGGIPSIGSMQDTTNSAVSTASGIASGGFGAANSAAQAVSTSIVASVKNNISLYLGQFLYFPSVVITDVNPTYDVILADDKNPMRAVVNINFRTFYTPTDRDIELMFPGTAGNRKKAYSNAQGY